MVRKLGMNVALRPQVSARVQRHFPTIRDGGSPRVSLPLSHSSWTQFNTDTVRTIRDGEAQDCHFHFHTAPELNSIQYRDRTDYQGRGKPRTAASSFTQLLSSELYRLPQTPGEASVHIKCQKARLGLWDHHQYKKMKKKKKEEERKKRERETRQEKEEVFPAFPTDTNRNWRFRD